MPDLVVYSLEPWDDVWRRNQYFVRATLDQYPDVRVLFVEPPSDPLHDRVKRRPGVTRDPWKPYLRYVHLESGRQVSAFRPVKILPRKIHAGADRFLARQVVKSADRLGLTRPVLWINDPAGEELRRMTSWDAVYDITDDWLLAGRPKREINRLAAYEATLLQKASSVVACSAAIAAAKAEAATTPISVISNGVDAQLYRNAGARPSDLPTGLVALYAGTLHTDRLDVDLCARTARALPEEASLVLLGPNSLEPHHVTHLERLGVVILGARPHREVPSYLMHADLLVVPHVDTPFTRSLDPIKAYEYAAARRPVVSTPVVGFLDLPPSRGWVVCNDEFPSAVHAALKSAWTHPIGEDSVPPSWDDQGREFASVLARAGRWGKP